MATVSPEIKALFQQAQRAHSQGRLEVAQALYSRILGLNERLPEVHFHLGRLEMQRKAPKPALRHLRRARELKPGEPLIWRLMLDALIASGDAKGVTELLRAAKSAPLPPQVGRELAAKARLGNRSGAARLAGADAAGFQAAVSLFQSGQHAGAAEAAEALHRQAPRSAPVLAVLGAACAALGRIEEAESAYTRAIALDDGYAEAHLQLGQLLHGRGRFEEATAPLARAMELMPQSPIAARFTGLNLLARGQARLALPQLEAALAAAPEDAPVTLALARAHLICEAPEAAGAVLAPLTAAAAPAPDPLALMGEILAAQDDFAGAAASFEQALAQDEGHGPALTGLADLHHQRGDFEASARFFARACASGAVHGGLARNYAASRKLAADDPLLPALRSAYAAGSEQPGTRPDLAFALAKAEQDMGRPAESFALYRAGNAMLAEAHPPPADSHEAVRRAMQAWRPDTPHAAAPEAGTPRLLFISGMPRSGTTLVEQIISSHSAVAPGGEMGLVSRALRSPLELAAIEGRGLTAAEVSAAAAEISAAARAQGATAPQLTDKGLLATNLIGYAPRVAPGSRFIAIRRDPRDNCLSMFKSRFMDGTQQYTNDLRSLGQAYLAFLEGLAFWRREAPESFLEIRYEDIVAAPEQSARALIAHCDLPWEEACLRFHENARTVKTLSAYQVRQPLYASSVGAWRQHEEALQPLIEILRDGGALEEWD